MDDTSDDFLGLGGGPSIPSVRAETTKRTAAPVEQVSDEARRNRRRRASLLTKDFGVPKLGIPELIGTNL